MKLKFLSQFGHHAAVPTILLVLASAQFSYGMTQRHRRYQTNQKVIQTHMQYMVPQKVEADGWYQPPRSPGYNEHLGG
jgi:hypothetical protein